jgi:hypothetical protein
MQGAQNPARQQGHKAVGDGWLIVEQRRIDPDNGGEPVWEFAWSHDGGRGRRASKLAAAWRESEGAAKRAAHEQLLAQFPPSRWVRVPRIGIAGSGITVTGHGDPVTMFLPATLRAVVEVVERTSAGDKRAAWKRSSCQEVTIEVDRQIASEGTPRASVESVMVRRLGDTSVTAGVVRNVHVGELVDWLLTRPPVVHTSDGGYLGPGHRPAAEALRAVGRRTGRRSEQVVTPSDVAYAVAAAPPRRQGATLAEAFPNVGRRYLMRRLAEARDLGLVEHTSRSRSSGTVRRRDSDEI